ncbi:MAG TPA: ABC transporter permease, partial [Blastocatellia bacterium]
MFFRIASKAFIHRRSRIAVAMLALSVGAAVTAAMLSVYYDAARKMRSELRAYGANVMIAPIPGQTFIGQDIVDQISNGQWPAEIAAASPFLYIVATERTGASSNRVVVNGTWIDASQKISPWWKVDGDWITDRGDLAHCLVGTRLARQLRLGLGQQLTLQYRDQSGEAGISNDNGGRSAHPDDDGDAKVEVAGILSTGGPEEDQILISLPAAQKLSGMANRLSAVAISALGDTSHIEGLAAQLNARMP